MPQRLDSHRVFMKQPPLICGNRGNQGRKLSIKELHAVPLDELITDEVLDAFFQPRQVDALSKARILESKSRKKARHQRSSASK